jgi:hypothetical protein
MKPAKFYIGQQVRKRKHGLGKENTIGIVQEVIAPGAKFRMYSYKVLLNGSSKTDIVVQSRLEANDA